MQSKRSRFLWKKFAQVAFDHKKSLMKMTHAAYKPGFQTRGLGNQIVASLR
jgi:hypothetical protein